VPANSGYPRRAFARVGGAADFYVVPVVEITADPSDHVAELFVELGIGDRRKTRDDAPSDHEGIELEHRRPPWLALEGSSHSGFKVSLGRRQTQVLKVHYNDIAFLS
jgi:hypothetical protein